MKKFLLPLFIGFLLISCSGNRPDANVESGLNLNIDSTEVTNNFYDNTETVILPLVNLSVGGEISNPGQVDLSSLPLRSVIVKEALLDSSGGNRFTGAFRYDGYSLFDILEKRIIEKANADEFAPVIDLFIEIENEKGEKVVFSWGEIFYPNNLHKIIIATRVSRIVPSKTKELWDLPEESKIVAASDLITERNISSPVKITVRSLPQSFKVTKGMSPMYSDKIEILSGKAKVSEILEILPDCREVTFNTIFYGRGRGIHSTTPFKGIMVKDVLVKYYPLNQQNIRNGLLCFAGKDGYRCALSWSEIFNRNDQQEFLFISSSEGEEGGLFRMFAAADFFSDRAIKSLCRIQPGYDDQVLIKK